MKSIDTFDGRLDESTAPMSVTLTLEDEIDISRGDMIASAHQPPEVARQFDATVVWMHEQPLDPGRTYWLKHTAQTIPAEIKSTRHRINITTLDREPAATLGLNEIGVLRIEASRPIYFDSYAHNRGTGSFILIDPANNATVAAGMILAPVSREQTRPRPQQMTEQGDRVTPVERIARYRHSGATVSLGSRIQLAWLLERKLFDRGCAVSILERADDSVLEILQKAGLLVLLVSDRAADWPLPADNAEAAQWIEAMLEETGVLLPEESLTGGEGI